MTSTPPPLPLLDQEHPFYVQGPAGRLECSGITPPDAKMVCIISHPHPLHQGTKMNKVITSCMQVAKTKGIALRYNFRGVGLSEGVHDHGQGEEQDLQSVYDWARHTYPTLPITLMGFSFGAMITYQFLSHGHASTHAILIAPPCTRLQVGDALSQSAWILAEHDELFPLEAQTQWIGQHHPDAVRHIIPNAGHFFHKKLALLKHTVEICISSASTHS